MTHWQVQLTADNYGVVQFAVDAPDYEAAVPLISQRIRQLDLPPELPYDIFVEPSHPEHWLITDDEIDVHFGLRDECANPLCHEESP